METMTTTHGCDLAADAPKAYVLLPAGLLRTTGEVRLRDLDVSLGPVLSLVTGFAGRVTTGCVAGFVAGFPAVRTAPSIAPPGPPLTT